MPYLHPNCGGCWFCVTDNDGDWAFSIEFDTWLHLSCLRKALAEDPDNCEAQIMAEEFGLMKGAKTDG